MSPHTLGRVAMCDLSPYPRPTCWSLMLCPPEKQRSIEHVLLECLCCHFWKYDLSAMNWRWHPWMTSWLKLKFWKGYVGFVVAWLVCVYSLLGLETWHAAMQKTTSNQQDNHWTQCQGPVRMKITLKYEDWIGCRKQLLWGHYEWMNTKAKI